MKKSKLRVGFDLDGVILYNPIRTFRVIASSLKFTKPLLFHEKTDEFYFPNSPVEQFIWRQLHKTSFCLADGIEKIKKLTEQGKIETFLITGRYSFLKKDFEYWLKKMEADTIFKGYYYNKNDQQPNLFKQQMIKKLQLDYFVEDNWGIIQKLNGVLKTTKVIWISNFLDRNIRYKYKFFGLNEVAEFLSNLF